MSDLPRRSRAMLRDLLAAAELRPSQRLNLWLRDYIDRRLFGLRLLRKARVGTVVVEKQHLAGDDHCPAALLAGVLVGPGLILQPPDHPHSFTLAHVLVDHLG